MVTWVGLYVCLSCLQERTYKALTCLGSFWGRQQGSYPRQPLHHILLVLKVGSDSCVPQAETSSCLC